MAWPQANEFQESVQNPRLAFSDPDLRSSEAKTNALGLPHAVSGQFGIVYEMKAADGRCWAVKCFTGPSSDRQRRYQAIGARLKQVNLPFMVGIDYLEQGVRIGGQWYPILKMDWVQGQTLNEFVGQRVDQPHLLEGLLDMWVKVAQRLRETDVTHADLQHGNVMLIPGIVEGKVSLRLVDYDGMYLPALAGLPSGEMGHRDFQHPKRLATSYYGPEVDRFSHLVIYTALLAVREKGKGLWGKYSSGDNLLFTQADFANPGNSKILLDLWREGSDDLRALTGRLVLATKQSLKDVPHLSDVLANGRALSLSGEQVRDVNRNLNGEPSQQRPALPARAIVDQPLASPPKFLGNLHRRWKELIPNKRTRLGVVLGLVGIVLLVIGFIAVGGKRGSKPDAKDQEKEIGPVAANMPKAKIKTTPPKKTKDDLHPTAIEPQAKTLLVPDDKLLTFDLGSNVNLEMVKIHAKGKKFVMGSPKDEASRRDDEVEHEVSFNHDFYLGKFEVTQEQFESIMGTNRSQFKNATDPVENVSWDDAQEFIKKLNAKFKDRKLTFRLPSEAEWEYACRAGTTTPFHFGNELNGDQANCNGTEPYGTTVKGPYLRMTMSVGGYIANAFGLYDMHGNVWEWCEDYYGPYSAAPKEGTAQRAKQSSDCRVLRGGSWYDGSWGLRSAVRTCIAPDSRSIYLGFRVALTPQDDESKIDLPKGKDPVVVAPPPVVSDERTNYDLGNNVKLEMVKIAAKGKTFQMGSPKDEADRNVNEEQREVSFNHDFYIGKFEVTQEQYVAIMGTNPSKFKGAKSPVETVSWDDAQEFIKRLNAKFKDRKGTFRLPSEAEWEYACRAGTTTPFHFGKELNGSQANSMGTNPYGTTIKGPYLEKTRDVGGYEANAFGLYDMHGNVLEWCEDYYGAYKDSPTDGTAQTAKLSSNVRVFRGGSWGDLSKDCRSAFHSGVTQDNRNEFIGLRVAMSLQADDIIYDLGNTVKLDMIKINAKGKKFMMGSPKDEAGRNDNEEQHEVLFNHDFYIGKFEVTQEQYEAIMGTNPSSFKGAKNPVETVSWDDAQEFIKKLNAKFKDRNVTFRLPSEAEWEYACRAGTTTPFHFGSESNGKQSNCDGSDPYGTIVRGPYLNRTRSVSAYEANAFGLYDMHGNVCEWCEDYYGPYSEAPKGGTSQRVKQSGDHRVLRGGCWEADPGYCRSAKRVNVEQGYRKNHGGFRVALTPQDDESKTDLPKGKDPIVVAPPPVVSDERTNYDLGNNVKLEMVKISAKGKKFLMGSPKEEAGRGNDEEQHEVTFNHDFYLGKFEVTQEQYEAMMGTNPSHFKGAKNPVEKVSWDDAQEFLKKLNAKLKDRKVTFRLPSEAEWEYACRAGTTTPFHFGTELNGKQANSDGTRPYATRVEGPYLRATKSVGSYDANGFLLYDMHGNVWEWCEDDYGPYSTAPKDGTAQRVKQSGGRRVLRGGSWGSSSEDCRSAYRDNIAPDDRFLYIGFRVALSPQDDEAKVNLPKGKDPVVEALPPVVSDERTNYDLGNNVNLEMVKINAKGKKFFMGSPMDEAGRNVNEEHHEVSFNHDFYMGKFEVTQEQYEAITGTNPSSFKAAKNPVEQVSWEDAQAFIKKLNARFTDRKVTFRLPTEAEWEYACRAGTTTPFHFGKDLNGKQANCNGTVPYGTTVKGPNLRMTKSVGGNDANAFGLCDMHGNVWEWCEDFYGPYSAAPKDGTAQRFRQSGDRRVLRGGSWFTYPEVCRSAIRLSGAPGNRSNDDGFRVVASQ